MSVLRLLCWNFQASTGGVGDLAGQAEFDAEVVDPAGQGAGLDHDDGGAVLLEALLQLVPGGGEGVEAGGSGGAVVDAGDGLVFAEVEGENGPVVAGVVVVVMAASSLGVSGTGNR